MKKGIIIGAIVIVIIAGGGSYYAYTHNNKNKAEIKTQVVTNNDVKVKNNSESKEFSKDNMSFTKEDISNYYKLSQNVGDIGLPSASMTTNLDAYKTINGVKYYSTYSYDTRAAYQNDTSTPQEGNHSHMVSSKIISLNKQTISDSEFGAIDTSKMNNQEIESQIYKIAAMYVEGYTANNPNLVISVNDNYEGNLNAIPKMQVNLNNYKNSKKGKLYEVMASLNGYNTPIYVGLDGYIYVSSEQDFNQLFFPNKIQ